jgi:hypothetical protein
MAILYYICIVLIGLDAVIGFAFIKKLGYNIYPIVWAVGVSFTDEIMGLLSGLYLRKNLLVFYISTPIEYALFAWFFYRLINNKTIKRLISISVLLFCLGSVVNIFLINNVHNTITFILIKGFLLTILSLLHIYNLFADAHKKLNLSELLISLGILFYYAFSAIYWTMIRFMVNTSQIAFMMQIRPILLIMTMIMYISIMIALFIKIRNVNFYK